MNKPFAITLNPGSSLANRTGSWRTERPVYVDRLPPCNNQCPAGEDIQGWLFHAESGNYQAAWQHLTRDNPFPAIMGRVCYHTCEGACNRAQLDSAVGITRCIAHALERLGHPGLLAWLATNTSGVQRAQAGRVVALGLILGGILGLLAALLTQISVAARALGGVLGGAVG